MEPDRRSQVSDLYHAALQRPAEDRAAFLQEACNGDETLRQEVESLLRFESASLQFLERPAAGIPGALASSPVGKAMVGRQLGPYRIVTPLGAGGMGEVYRAHDSKLGRDVAIKILSAQFTADPERRARFAREARLLATLNHPHIGAIYGLEEADGVTALVLELVEGPTLADRLERGPLPVTEALAIARQIAEALEAAHEKGIVHRDLKPANVVLQTGVNAAGVPSGDSRAKVLDFGLAKTMALGLGLTQRPPGSLNGTEEGRILGTPAYMSPEQARGQPIDKRTDIWAFGCVLFEMLAGRRAFEGATVTDTFVRVLEREPDWNALPAATPQAVRTLLRRCLEKDPARRTRDIGDVRLELEDSHSTEPSEPVGAPRPPAARRRPRLWVATAVFGLVLGTAVGAWWVLQSRVARAVQPATPAMRLPVDLGPDVSLTGPVLISPNGERLVYASNGRLETRRLDQERSVPLTGTEGASQFVLSHDSQQVAFLVDGKLKRVALEGGSVMTIADAPFMRGGTWAEDGTIVIGSSNDGLLRINVASRGRWQPLTRKDPGEFTHRQPQFLPGGKAVLFTCHTRPESFDLARIEVVSLSGGSRKVLQEGAYFGRFVGGPDGTGYLTYFRAGTMWAVAFDPTRLETVGSPFPLMEDVAADDISGTAQVDASRTGLLVYRGENKVRVDWLESDGSSRPLLKDPGYYRYVKLSPDRRRLLYSSAGDLTTYDLDRGTTAQLTRGIRVRNPIWTPDGRFVVFSTLRGLSWVRSDGPSEPRLLFEEQNPPLRLAFSFRREDNRLAYNEIATKIEGKVWGKVWTVPVRIDGSGLNGGRAEAFLATPAGHPHFSPDGRWVAYTSDKTGREEIYVKAFPDNGREWPVSINGGSNPSWSRSELFFRQGDLLMAAPYTTTTSEFHVGKQRMWSTHGLVRSTDRYGYSVAPDGTRVAAILPDPSSDQHSRRHVTLWINATSEIRQQEPGRR